LREPAETVEFFESSSQEAAGLPETRIARLLCDQPSGYNDRGTQKKW